MVKSKFEAQQQTILHYWQNGICSAKEIHKKTGISPRTVENNLCKLEECNARMVVEFQQSRSQYNRKYVVYYEE